MNHIIYNVMCVFVCARSSAIMMSMGSSSMPRLIKPSMGESEVNAWCVCGSN